MHRDYNPIYKISNELDIDEEEAREAMIIAQITFNPPEEAFARAYNTGYRFFVEEQDAESTASERTRSIDEVQKEIREFVGAVYLDSDVEERELTTPPDEFEGESPGRKSFDVLIQSWVSQEIEKIGRSSRSIDITAGIDLSPILSSLSSHQDVVNQKPSPLSCPGTT